MQDDPQSAPENDELQALFEYLQQGSDTEREHILDDLLQRAQKSGDPEHWNVFALGLQAAGRLEDAINIFKQLIEAFPDRDIYRLSLATTYSQAAQFELCRYHLRYLEEHGASEEMRDVAKEQLTGMEHFLKKTALDEQLQQLQIASLRERIQSGEVSADDYQKLGKLLLLRERQGFEDVSLDETTAILEQGQKHFPEAEGVLELLIACYLRKDPQNRLKPVLKTLEKINPNSQLLQLVANIDDAERASYAQQMSRRMQELMMQVQAKDPELTKAAIEELRKIITMYPSNPDYRLTYAFALCIVGQCTEAMEQAELLDQNDIPSHTYHFNLGQIFWLCGDPLRGRQHLDLSIQYASTDEEKQDALERIAYLSKGGK